MHERFGAMIRCCQSFRLPGEPALWGCPGPRHVFLELRWANNQVIFLNQQPCKRRAVTDFQKLKS